MNLTMTRCAVEEEMSSPLRGEAYSAEHLELHFRDLALSLTIHPTDKRSDRRFSARFEENVSRISLAHETATEGVLRNEALPAEAEWLLDNYYVVEEQLREIRDDLPEGYYRQLPKTASGLPRVYELAYELIIHTDSSLDQRTIERCIDQFQSVAALSIGEVWAFPVMLRLVLVENLRRLCDQMLITHACRNSASEMLDSWKPETNFTLPTDESAHCIPTIIQLIEQIPDRSGEYRQATRILDQQVLQRGWNLGDLVHREHQRQAANQVSIGNVITSMRLIAGLEWIAFFERVNLVEQVLRRDAAGIYAQMNFASRDQYRHVVEHLARRTKTSDVEVAELAIAQAEQIEPQQSNTPPVNETESATQADSLNRTDRRRHVGYWLIDDGCRELERRLKYHPPIRQAVRHAMLRWPYTTYFGLLKLISVLAIVLVGVIGYQIGLPWWAWTLVLIASALPASEIALNLVNLLITNTLPPRILPRIEFKSGVPKEFPTIVVVPSMLSSAAEVESLLARLESHFLTNSDEALLFALLTDLTDAPQAEMPADAALIEQAVLGIRRLNDRYHLSGRAPFYLFHRTRQWNASEGVWMGWERKRGKLMEFGQLLHGDVTTSYATREGDVGALRVFRRTDYTPFVITLDSDTELPHGAAGRLIGTLVHPLNRAQFSPDQSRVTAGYSILQPRVNVHLAAAGRSWFSKIFAGTPGVDPYTTAASDVYQDLFGEGSFTGKGIYDLRAFERALDGAFPENQILSHDLIEGCHARVGLVTNIEVFDSYPSRYDADSRRTHRWVRGDWQILPWILPRVPYAAGWKRNPLSLLSRWKVLDNLRRSLVAPALLAAVLLIWFVAPRHAWVGTLGLLLVLFFPLLIQLFMTVRDWPWASNARAHWRAIRVDLLKTVAQCGLAVLVLPHKAYNMLDAIARTLFRMLVTRRHLLEWETAAAVEATVNRNRASMWRQLWIVPAVAVVIGIFVPWPALAASAPILLAWLIAPAIVEVLNRPIDVSRSQCSESQLNWLRQIASETWAFFEAFVGAADNWLPVDNIQEQPQEKVAHRLSPTNEGLFLLSAVAARDFGLIGSQQLITLLENNLSSLEKLDKLNGHYFNWYSTETLLPLQPRYVSTVDSGNLAACLLTLRQGLDELLHAPLLSEAQVLGVRDTLALVRAAYEREATQELARDRIRFPPLLQRMNEFESVWTTPQSEATDWSKQIEALRELLLHWNQSPAPTRNAQGLNLSRKIEIAKNRLQGTYDDATQLQAWLVLLPQVKVAATSAATIAWNNLESILREHQSIAQIAAMRPVVQPAMDQLRTALAQDSAAVAWLDQLALAIDQSAADAAALKKRYEHIAELAEDLAISMDFRFLYDPQRRLFSIGYNIEEERLDRSHYDMLCSEARLASQLAIAKGDVEQAHWFQLGRHSTIAAGQFALLSWGGTMFEYLMPPLFQRQYEGSLLTQSCRAATIRQQEFGHQNGVPWGVSESAFGALAVNADYHYRSFGVPGLGLKRGLAKDLVISPYSSLLALAVDPLQATLNLTAIVREGGHGEWGFYEALDYTPERLPFGQRRILVRCYMAHHQGMGMLALANLLLDDSVQRRFSSHPLARATELLLQERVPRIMTPFEVHADEVEPVAVRQAPEQLVSRRLIGWQTPSPRTHLLSNGEYSLMLTSAGSGYSRWHDRDITRWRSDSTLDHWGQYIYLRNLDDDTVWSATYQPTGVTPDHYEVIFSVDKAEFSRRQGELETLLEVAVSPENNAEVRQLQIRNHGSETRHIQLTSYAEVAMNSAAADLAHPAFQKLFIETEFVANEAAILARRRPRDASQPAQWALHVLATPSDATDTIQFDTSRQSFLGRRATVQQPQAIWSNELAGAAGAVLDPIFALRCTVVVPPGASVTVAWTTAVANSREEALTLADQYHELRNVQRVFELAWAYTQVELRHQHLSPGQAHLYQRLASHLLYPHRSMRGEESLLRQNQLGQSGFWRHGISGDLPILLARVTEPEHIALARDLLLAHRFWRDRGFQADVVVINDYPGSYSDALQEQLVMLLQEVNTLNANQRGKVYLLRGPHLPAEEQTLFEAAATCVLHGDRGPLTQQLDDANLAAGSNAEYAAGRSSLSRQRIRTPQEPSPESLEFWNGYGGFADGGREYHIRSAAKPPMPWSHVVANPRLGFVVTETGGGYTWFENSRENKLTTWSNDPVSDPPGEVLYIRDDATGEFWLPLSGEGPNATDGEGWTHYGAGYARFIHQGKRLKQQVTVSVAPDQPLKSIQVELTNQSDQPRTFTLSYNAETVLGVAREQTMLFVNSTYDEQSRSILLRNAYHPEYPQQVAFLTVLDQITGHTADRGEFLGRHGSWQCPKGIVSGKLRSRTGVAYDPCACVQTKITLAPGESRQVTFLLGAGKDETEARSLLNRFSSPEAVEAAVQANCRNWDEVLSTIQVKTPNRALDLLVNRWLLYQVLCCRVWARSAFYQSGGAYGFRDQLQDCMALVHARPEIVREHLLRAAARQYVQGDVQHWWHPPLGKGTRTRFSDDLLWLPLVVSHYVKTTGDVGVLEEMVPLLESPLLQPDEHERYEQPKVAAESITLYQHCLRAIDRGMQFGPHGLPLMGCGDWNDGMNKVGEKGQGESVWVGWFLLVLLKDFMPLMRQHNDTIKARQYQMAADALRSAIEEHAWDGEWYRRAYFDDGTPLGSISNDECRIDSLAQTWAVFAEGKPERVHSGMRAAMQQLVDPADKLVLLFTPPFDQGSLDPGYIKGYVPGIRENGGQYTHAAIWMIQALAQMGNNDEAMSLFDLINPILHATTATDVAKYQVEPYVVAADVYGAGQHVGRGGWTWYTGSAAWLYRAALEQLLGLQISNNVATLNPCVPASWEEFEVTITRDGKQQRIVCRREPADTQHDDGTGESRIQIDLTKPSEQAVVVPLPPEKPNAAVPTIAGLLQHPETFVPDRSI
ncbi:MAG: glucoamylase family protein [Planctomycetota bacterium]|nr:glucoamylase family protein [Planctomycetota bacterium]